VKGFKAGVLTISVVYANDPCTSLGLGVQWRVGAVGTTPPKWKKAGEKAWRSRPLGCYLCWSRLILIAGLWVGSDHRLIDVQQYSLTSNNE
jgi:hypothetical protein